MRTVLRPGVLVQLRYANTPLTPPQYPRSVSTLAALLGLPVAAILVWSLLRSGVGRGLGRTPQVGRWQAAPTPLVGGLGIYAGLMGGVFLAVATGGVAADSRLIGVMIGASMLFLAGLADDLRALSPVVKLASQAAAAGVVLATGTRVEIFHSTWIAVPLGVLWLVGLTNAFNLLDNMDGLAGSLAVIAAGFFACDAWVQPEPRYVLVISVALAAALLGFLPFNLRPGRRALAWMGDSGSQTIGFTLAALGLGSSYTVASSTVATLVLPVLVLAVPILDTTLVTMVRVLEGRPVSQGGRDHSSHRLVSLGVSETGAVVLLALISAALGATSLAYEAFNDGRIATVGVLVSFALLVEFGSFLADVGREQERRTLRWYVYIRRLAEVAVDGALVAASFLVAYLLAFNGIGTPIQRHDFLLTLPVILFARYVALLLFGTYAGVWRYASAREALRASAAVVISEVAAVGFLELAQGPIGGFPRSIFVMDAVLCAAAITAARFTERGIVLVVQLARASNVRRVLIVGAGRSGRSLLRELRETPGQRVVGFIDDAPSLRGRRLNGVKVITSVAAIDAALARTTPDIVFVTIPGIGDERVDVIARACAAREIELRLVRREIDLAPSVVHADRST
jgi:UDP-GlcNAc:undecaprenyl-phosphate/decaprenyl-phosphate GlcNAc-1-phosphate transferase